MASKAATSSCELSTLTGNTIFTAREQIIETREQLHGGRGGDSVRRYLAAERPETSLATFSHGGASFFPATHACMQVRLETRVGNM